jgi:hypothetical protein
LLPLAHDARSTSSTPRRSLGRRAGRTNLMLREASARTGAA